MQIAFMLCISYGPATSTRIFASLYAAQTVKPRLGWPGQLPRLCQGICGHRVSSREFYVLPVRTWIMFLCMSRQQLVLLQHCNVPPRPVVPALYSGCGYLPDFNETVAAHTAHSAQCCTSCALHATITDFVDIHRRWIFLSDTPLLLACHDNINTSYFADFGYRKFKADEECN